MSAIPVLPGLCFIKKGKGSLYQAYNKSNHVNDGVAGGLPGSRFETRAGAGLRSLPATQSEVYPQVSLYQLH
jgi:hypothetical protein